MQIIPLLPLTALSFVVLYKTSHIIKYYAKLGFGLGIIFVFQFVLIPIFVFRPQSLRNIELIAWIGRMVTPFFGLEYIIEGQEHLPKEKPFIIVANHQGPADILAQCACCGVIKNVLFTCNRFYSFVGVFGILCWLAGIVFIERRFSEYTENQLNAALTKMKKENAKLWIFPEGRITLGNIGDMHSFKKGAFHCAIKAKVPIVPIVFSPNTWYDRMTFRFDGGTVIARILSPVSTDNFAKDQVNELSHNVRNLMIKHLKELKNVTQ